MPTLRVEDRTVHFTDTGHSTDTGSELPLMVLVHSGGLSSRQWSRYVSRFAPTHRVVAPDLLGSGKSDPVPADAPFSYHADVDVLDALLEHLDAGPAHLVGHSYGGLVALACARRRPERARTLSLFEPVAFGVLFSSDEDAAIRNLTDYDHDGTFFDDATGGSEAWLERFVDWWQGEGAWRAMSDAGRASLQAVGRKVFQEVRSLTADRTPHHAYASLDVPTLLMSGARSPLAARTTCAVLARSLPCAALATFDDAGHMAPLTHTHPVADRIAEHIAPR